MINGVGNTKLNVVSSLTIIISDFRDTEIASDNNNGVASASFVIFQLTLTSFFNSQVHHSIEAKLGQMN